MFTHAPWQWSGQLLDRMNCTNPDSIIYMELTAQNKKATREKGPATALELGTSALLREEAALE